MAWQAQLSNAGTARAALCGGWGMRCWGALSTADMWLGGTLVLCKEQAGEHTCSERNIMCKQRSPMQGLERHSPPWW